MTIRLGYGLITCQRHPDDHRGWPDLYDEAVELAVRADRAGLDSVWVSEHHFVDDGHLPALLPTLAAMAAVTDRVQLGTGLLLAPLHDPVRVAEDAAVVDLISHGRLVIGLGLGWRAEEFEVFGVPQRQRVRRLREAVATLRAAWSGHATRHDPGDNGFGYVTPLPFAPGGPPIWIGALTEPALRRAGELADGVMATEVTPGELREAVDRAREGAAAAGRDPDALSVALHLPTLVTERPTPWSAVRALLSYPGWKYDDMDAARGSVGALRPPGPLTADVEERLRETSLTGTPEQVSQRILEYAEAAGGDLHFVARSYLPGQDPAARRAALDGLVEVRSLWPSDPLQNEPDAESVI